jgi:LPPG:FO 2-phospho-L-lactate transferase
VRTVISTDAGDLAFQEYLVQRRARPKVRAVRYRGVRAAKPAPGVLEAIARSKRIILAPSNPFVSLGPILAVPGIRSALASVRERVVAVSPLIGGRAVKGPLASMLRSMGHGANVASIGALLGDVASTMVVSPGDAPPAEPAAKREARERRQPAFVEHDILLLDPRRAEKLARILVAPELAVVRTSARSSSARVDTPRGDVSKGRGAGSNRRRSRSSASGTPRAVARSARTRRTPA